MYAHVYVRDSDDVISFLRPRTSGPTVAEALIVTRKCNDAFSEVYLAVWNSLSSAEVSLMFVHVSFIFPSEFDFI